MSSKFRHEKGRHLADFARGTAKAMIGETPTLAPYSREVRQDCRGDGALPSSVW
jgi:hypothetical protein